MSKKQPERKNCERCAKVAAVLGEKYCKRCRGAVLYEMREKGYLQNTTQQRRPSENLGRSSRDCRVIANDFGRDHYGEDE